MTSRNFLWAPWDDRKNGQFSAATRNWFQLKNLNEQVNGNRFSLGLEKNGALTTLGIQPWEIPSREPTKHNRLCYLLIYRGNVWIIMGMLILQRSLRSKLLLFFNHILEISNMFKILRTEF
jgi:hypothetical protein